MIERIITPQTAPLIMPKMARWLAEQFRQGMTLKITISEYELTRSNAQNRLLFGVWYKEIVLHLSEHYGIKCSPAALHEDLIQRLGYYKVETGLNGDVIVREKTSKMGVKRFTKLLNDLEQYALENWQLRLSHPDDLYLAAMYKQESSNGK